ncbi:MAG: hypothetical protein ACK4F4_01890 [Hylemonella sp.]|jgi:hypothetical protein|uniref:hypothetical protein n=1 Tax=Hylemonella sp. TaxID=2066020 RepID=UPI00391C0170
MKRLLSPLAALMPLLAQAHEGHGLGGAHWHATDVLGFIAVAVLVGVAIWTLRK